MEQQPEKRPKRLLAGLGIGALAVLALAALGSSNGPTSAPVVNQFAPQEQAQTVQLLQERVVTPTQLPSSAAKKEAPVTRTNTSLSNDNYYTNVDANPVHSPAYSDGVPAGASARCGDGAYSFSQHRQGTCSHHGGVSEWL